MLIFSFFMCNSPAAKWSLLPVMWVLKELDFFFVFKFLQEVVRKKIGLSALPETQERKLTVSESGTQTKCE